MNCNLAKTSTLKKTKNMLLSWLLLFSILFIHPWLVLVIVGSMWIDVVADKAHLSWVVVSRSYTAICFFMFVSHFALWLPWHRPLSKKSWGTVFKKESCWVTWPYSLRCLTVASRSFWFPASPMTMLHSKSMALCSLYEILISLLRHKFSNTWILLSVLASKEVDKAYGSIVLTLFAVSFSWKW